MFLKRSSLPLESESHLDSANKPQEKSSYEKRQERIEQKAAEQKKETDKEKQERLEFLKFPNIMGWYFDGTFTKDFTLHEEYAEYFNEIEDELDAQKDLIIEETFTEKAYRNFWPPVYYGGKYFRTRGIYLDLKEVKEDPPKTPPNINYEKQRGVIGIELGGEQDAVSHTREIKQFHDTYGQPGHQSTKDNWYWNEVKRDFRAKDVDGDYIWSDDERIWREGDPTYRTPYDWYFDDKQGRYYMRDHTTPELYSFDQERNIYKRVGVKGPSANGLRNNDYYYDERNRKWVQIGKTHPVLKMYLPGVREVANIDRGKSGLTPDDFYYDGEAGKMELRDEHDLHEYFYDTNDKMFKKKNQPHGPGKANLYPQDYEFDVKLGKYHPKPAKECRHFEPYDWYFDMDQGKYFKIDRLHREKYVFDAENCIYKLKDAKGPSANELGQDDYFWDENTREWKLTIILKDPSVLQYNEHLKRKYLPGERGKSGKIPDDFYYDAFDGSYFRKLPNKMDSYWYDTVDEVWKKRGQHYGPGYFQLYPYHYYFDYDEGFWFPTATAKQILAKQRRGEVKTLSDLTPYDYAFLDSEGDFQLRDNKINPRMYKYNPQTGVFHKDGPKGVDKKAPNDFFYDEPTTSWLPLEHPKGHEAKDYKFGRRNNRIGPRGRSGKIPDDYYFSFTEGTFLLKDPNDKAKEYEYLSNIGVWKESKQPETQNSDIPNPSSFYFDKEEGAFVLKNKLQYGEIALNPNTNLWMQKWRSPKDYYWEPRQNKYLRKSAKMIQKENEDQNGPSVAGADGASAKDKKLQEEAEREREKRNRDYERPWLHHYLELAADEIRFEQELLKQTKKENSKKKFQKKAKAIAIAATNLGEDGVKPNETVAPSEELGTESNEQIVPESGKKKKQNRKPDKRVTIKYSSVKGPLSKM